MNCRFCTLLPGDVILTGTPAGSGGFAKPPHFLKVRIILFYIVTNDLILDFLNIINHRKETSSNVRLKN